MHERVRNPATLRAASYTWLCLYVSVTAVVKLVHHPDNIWCTLVHWWSICKRLQTSDKIMSKHENCKESEQSFPGATFTECLASLSHQVIYKKFHIPCPFEEFSANNTAVHLLSTALPMTDIHHDGHVVDDAHCSPRMFTMNSQVLFALV